MSKKKDKKKDKKRDRDRDRDRDRRQSREEDEEDEPGDATPKKSELEALLDRKFKDQQQDLEKIFDSKIEKSESKLKNWVKNEREPAIHQRVEKQIEEEVAKHLQPLVGEVDMIRKAAARSLRTTGGPIAYVSNVDPDTTLEARKKMVNDALAGTEKKAEKVDSKEGAKDFKVYFAKPETLQLFLGKWLEKQYRNSAGAPIFAKKNKDPRLRALEAPMVKLTKQIRHHYFVNKEKRKVDFDDDTVKVDKRVVARLSGGKIEWEDANLKLLFGEDEDM